MSNANTTPLKAKGMANIMMNGLLNDSNCEAITMYTSIMMRSARVTISLEVFCWSS